MKHFRSLLLIVSFFLVISCEEKPKYNLSATQADLINTPKDGVIIDRIGGEGPYRWTGGLRSNTGKTVTFTVKENGVIQSKEFEGKPNVFYDTENFENELGDGYMVIYKRTISQTNEP